MHVPTSLLRAPVLALLVACLCGCGRTFGDAAAGRAEAPAVQEVPVTAASPTDAPQANSRVNTATPASVGPLDPAVAACAPPDGGRPWTETGRADDGDYVYVFLEHADAGASADFSSAAVMLADGQCEGDVVSGPGEEAISTMRIPSDDVWASLVDQSFSWHVTQSGGVGPFADILRAAYGGLTECAPGQDSETCAPMWLSERLRRAGVTVGLPR